MRWATWAGGLVRLYGLIKDATGSADIGLLCSARAARHGASQYVIAGHDRRLERIPPRHAAAE